MSGETAKSQRRIAGHEEPNKDAAYKGEGESMSKGEGKTDPGKSQMSFVMTADDAERYAPPAEVDPRDNLQKKGLHGKGKKPIGGRRT